MPFLGFQTAKPSTLKALFLVIIANKFQDYKENIPTNKDKTSTLGTQYFKLNMFRYEENFLSIFFKRIQNGSDHQAEGATRLI